MDTVKMKLNTFCICEMGAFSEIRCGLHVFYVYEHYNEAMACGMGDMPTGIYDCVPIDVEDGLRTWAVCDLPFGKTLSFSFSDDREQMLPKAYVGLTLGCTNNKWDVVEKKKASLKFDILLENVNTFRLYVERRNTFRVI